MALRCWSREHLLYGCGSVRHQRPSRKHRDESRCGKHECLRHGRGLFSVDSGEMQSGIWVSMPRRLAVVGALRICHWARSGETDRATKRVSRRIEGYCSGLARGFAALVNRPLAYARGSANGLRVWRSVAEEGQLENANRGYRGEFSAYDIPDWLWLLVILLRELNRSWLLWSA